MSKKAIDYTALRKALEAKKALLEKLIPLTEDGKAASELRADYRKVEAELSLFYDDEKIKT